MNIAWMKQYFCTRRVWSLVRTTVVCTCFYAMVLLYQYAVSPVIPECSNATLWNTLEQVLTKGVSFPYNNMTFDSFVVELTKKYDRGKGLGLMDSDTLYLEEPTNHRDRITPKTMFVFVQSDPMHFDRRDLIRRTYARSYRYGPSGIFSKEICVIFALGVSPNKSEDFKKKLQREITLNQDILLLNFQDIYDGLTVKGMLTMMWVVQQRPVINYIVKTDDDIMLNYYGWRTVIDALDTNRITCAIVGCVWKNPIVLRYDKSIVTHSEYLYDHYPSFVSGSGYLMTRDAVINILNAGFRMPWLKRDDPFFTGIIRNQLGIHLYSLPESSYLFHGTNSISTLWRQAIMVIHGESYRGRSVAWKKIRQIAEEENHQGHKVKIHRVHLDATPIPKNWLLPPDSYCLSQKCENKVKGKGSILFIDV